MKLYEILSIRDEPISIKDAFEHNEAYVKHLDHEQRPMWVELSQLRAQVNLSGPFYKDAVKVKGFFLGNQESLERYEADVKRATEIEHNHGYVAWWSFSGWQNNLPTVDFFVKITPENKQFLDKVKRFMYRYRKTREKLFVATRKRRRLRSSYMAWRRRQKAKGVEIKAAPYR